MFDAPRIGRALRAIRIRLALRQSDVAHRAGVSRSFVSMLELGHFRSSDMTRVESVCRALGADLDIRVRWRGEGLDRLLDEGHAAIVDRVVRVLREAGWEVLLEVTFSEYGERGSIDILGWRSDIGALLVVEVKTVVADAQGTLAPLDRKVRLAPKLARDRGWTPRSVSRVLVIGDGTTNRSRVARFDQLFSAALPTRGRDVRRWVKNPAMRIEGLWFLPDSTPGGTRRTTAGRSRVNVPRRS